MLSQDQQNEPVAETTSNDIDSAALQIYDSLQQEGFTTDQMVSVVKAFKQMVVSDIDTKMRDLQRLKTSF